ncbi:MAG: IS66 family insertion sequence element accessory protein TnpB [Crocinitomicaceae bacterium]
MVYRKVDLFTLSPSNSFHLCSEPTDLRKSFNGLSGLVENELGRTPLFRDVFLFINKKRYKIKLLHWDAGGYIL